MFCPHCTPANQDPVWHKTVTFIESLPSAPTTVQYVREMVENVTRQGYHVMVIEDSNHVYDSVRDNIQHYAPFVTKGSYLVVQDTRGGDFEGPTVACAEFLATQQYELHNVSLDHQTIIHANVNNKLDQFMISNKESGRDRDEPIASLFVRDRRPEYYIIRWVDHHYMSGSSFLFLPSHSIPYLYPLTI